MGGSAIAGESKDGEPGTGKWEEPSTGEPGPGEPSTGEPGPGERFAAVDAYLTRLLVGRDPALESALRASKQAGLPPISVTPLQGKLLFLLARMIGARKVLEIGTLGGYSAIWLGRAVGPGGRVITLEIDARVAEVARANLARAGLEDVVEVRVGPAARSLSELEGEAPFDLVFIDADKPSTPEYFTRALELVRPGSLVVVDNVVRGGAVLEGTDPDAQAMRRFLDLAGGDSRVEATALQTVGAKGHDGFAIALVVSEGRGEGSVYSV